MLKSRKLLVSSVLSLGLANSIISGMAVPTYAATSLGLNTDSIYEVAYGDTAEYTITIPSGTSGTLSISGTFASRGNQDITIYKGGKKVASDAHFWTADELGYDKLDLQLNVTPGIYTMKIYNKAYNKSLMRGDLNIYMTNYGESTGTAELNASNTAAVEKNGSSASDTTVENSTSEASITNDTAKSSSGVLKGTLKKNYSATYNVTVKNKMQTLYITGNSNSQHDQSVYVLDSEGTILDQDHTPDWSTNPSGASLSFRTVNLTKGTYKIRIRNQKNGSLKYNFSYKTKGSLNVGNTKVTKITASKKKLKVTYKKAKNASYYQIAYKTKGTGKWKTTTASGTSKILSGLKSGKTYQVKVRAVNGYLNGAYSSARTAKAK